MDHLADLDAPPAAAPADSPPAAPEFTFTGSGGEYFRIWIVNLLLTVATLGIYSAWAKTRRLQYFYRNTQLAGTSFDFLGDPMAILRGRIVAVVLVAAWQYAFGLSKTAGIVTVSLLLAGLPFMMRAALRFRLSNTVYRGLPFGFGGGIGGAYLAYLPAVATLVLPGALVAMFPGQATGFYAFALWLFWPLMHAAMRRYQHRHLLYGDQQASFSASIGRLAMPYLALLGLVLLLIVTLIIVGVLAAGIIAAVKADKHTTAVLMTGGFVSGTVLAYLGMLLAGLYVSVRIDNRAWSGTSFPGVTIHSLLRARGYLWLQTVNVVLTLLTLGLFRPFAAVRTWRYRLAHVRLDAPYGIEHATMEAARPRGPAAADSAADFFGLDISW